MITFGAANFALEPDQHLRLPRPRGRRDCRPGSRLHDRGHRLRRGARRRRSGVRRLCSAPPSTSSRTPTSSRRSPSFGPRGDCGPGSCATVRRDASRRRCGCASTARRRVVVDRARAAEQCRARARPGACGRLRRSAVAARERNGRSPGDPLRGRHEGGPADPADHPRGDRRRRHYRPAGRLVCGRGPDRPDRARVRLLERSTRWVGVA